MWNELYHDIIVDHSRHSPYRKKLESACSSSCGYNPMCGDEITLWACCRDGYIEQLTFEGQGCAISQASASLACSYLRNLTYKEARERIEQMLSLLTGKIDHIDVEELMALGEIKRFPMRVKCATMAWHASQDILKDK